MKRMDRFLQKWRIWMARPYIWSGARVLDIGCHQGELFQSLRGLRLSGMGIDPLLEASSVRGGVTLVKGWFPDDLPEPAGRFDVITALAILEHVPPGELVKFVKACADVLNEEGVMIVTVPSPLVDRILERLIALKILDGMSVEQHQDIDLDYLAGVFRAAGLDVAASQKFQLGLNNLFVFTSRDRAPAPGR